jgi:hypothetical protein
MCINLVREADNGKLGFHTAWIYFSSREKNNKEKAVKCDDIIRG